MSLDVTGGPAATGNGIRLEQWNDWEGANQRFRLVPLSPGSYQIMATHSGKCLDVQASSTQDFAPIQQWSCTGAANQQFRFVPLPASQSTQP